MSLGQRVERICKRAVDARALRVEVLAEIRAAVPFDAYVWLLTDPQTCVGAAPLAVTPPSLTDLPALIRLRYLTPLNRWTNMPSNTAATLVGSTGADRTRSALWLQLLAGHGIDDVLSTVFRDSFGCWGFLELWRAAGVFSAEESRMVASLNSVVTHALRTSQVSTFERLAERDHAGGPAVLLLSDALELLSQTPQTEAYLRALLPTAADRAPVPAAAYNVAAQLLARDNDVDLHPPWARVHVGNGLWVTLRAAPIERGSSAGPATIAVSIEPTPPVERTELYSRVVGLSDRESELLHHLVGGSDTRQLAQRLYVSEHTVQDHFKSIFAKTGVNSRRMLIARATGLA